MIDEDTYCSDVLTQLIAATKALRFVRVAAASGDEVYGIGGGRYPRRSSTSLGGPLRVMTPYIRGSRNRQAARDDDTMHVTLDCVRAAAEAT